ncbi:glycoside hydrolase family 2 [Salipaludibacillus neizhouensis]|uniref:Beta-mannosidase n=1 Tax=Salipaludibacillus neizhouensis TaxID=885475 RepID=A0A3A9K1I8_9BACI|nr:glycoside hydrolase family 2 protein [Salipaludibacillus neizhouensis]RKL66964.1 glycoside hydrolase family 2 [Salipaludibacillus neizhouensis]
MAQLSLNGNWKFKRKGDTEWLNALVPGSVYADLLENKKMVDPFYRDNEEEVKELSNYNYIYEKQFDLDQSIFDNDSVKLVFEGIDTISEIYINGTLISKTNNMHRTYAFDVSKDVHIGRNILKVVLFSPLQYVAKKHAENPIWGVEDAVPGFSHIRKAHSMFGWDWGPQLPDLGIWKNVSIKGESEAVISDVYISQDHQEDEVNLNVSVQTKQWQDIALTAEVSVEDPDGEIVVSEKQKLNESSTNLKLTVHNPKKWYPAQYGDQSLYKVTIELRTNGKLIDENVYNIGLRTIEVVRESDQWGKSFYFKINGLPIFSKGANYIPEDSILSRANARTTEELITNCVKANFNMIRVWGGGHYPTDEFYNLCDKYGLIVWQDFMFACAVYDLNEEFEETVREEVRDNIKRLRHHASLGLWCGNNEMEHAWNSWDFPKTEKHKNDYLTLFEKIIPTIVEDTDPETFYWPSSPSSGGNFLKTSDENEGDVHYWDVWHGLKPFTEYRKFKFRFVSEFGFQSFPSTKTIETFTKPEDRNIFSYVMEKHQKNGDANGKILYYLAENFKYPKDFESLVYTSQLLQGEAIKYGVEHWRRNMGRSMGAIYWQLNDCWPVASWASIDYYGRWKALHYFAKRFFAMTLLSAEESKTGANLVVTNDHIDPFKGTIKWVLRTAISEVLLEGEENVTVSSAAAKNGVSLDFTDLLSTYNKRRECFLEFTLEDESGAIISNGTSLFVPAKHFKFKNPELYFTVEEKEAVFEVVVRGMSLAKYVELSHQEDVVFSDNYFDVVGKGKSVKVEVDKKDSPMSLIELKEGLAIKSLYDSYVD